MKVLYWQFLNKLGETHSKVTKKLYANYINSNNPLSFYIEQKESLMGSLTPSKRKSKKKADKYTMVDTDNSSKKDIGDSDIIKK